MRTNICKKRIVAIFEDNHLLSIADVHKKIPEVNYSTVYRNIEQLIADKQIKKIVLDKGNVMYELNEEGHNHDHFLCTDCGDVEEIRISVKGISLLNNYKVNDLLIRGLCVDCNQKV